MAMPEQSRKKKKKRPRDLSQLAVSIVKEATGGEEPTKKEPTKKNPNAVALGRLGGLKGGKARASKLTAKQRQEIARKAALARWQKRK